MKKATLFMAMALSASATLSAETYFASPTGAGDESGDSWTNAFPAANIADILENVEEGDVIYLLEGKYTGASIRPVNGITVIGGFAAASQGTDLSLYNPWTNKTIFDAEGKNGATEAFIKISGEEGTVGAENPLTTLKGIVITGAVGLPQDDPANPTYCGTAFNCTRANVLLEDVTFDGNTSWCGGVTVPASGSQFHAKHCVWSNNTNINETTAKNNFYQSVLNGRGSTDRKEYTDIVLEGCVMVNNPIKNETARNNANYGGLMSFQDGCCNVMMVNCFADGGGLTINQNGGMMRMGNSSYLVMAFNTFFNFNTKHATESKGKVISINGNTPYFLQSNIIVDNTNGTSITPNYTTNTVSNGNKLDIAVFTQGFSNNHGNKVPLLQSGGDNLIGGFLVATIAKDQNGESGKVYTTNFLSEYSSDNWSAPAQGDVFAGTTTAKDGRYYILPKDSYKDVNTAEAVELFNSYEELLGSYAATTGATFTSQLPKDYFKFAKVDVSLDLFGNKRAATTYRGAYDPNATAVVDPGTGVASVFATDATMRAISMGNGNFRIEGAEGVAEVYDIAGRKVMATSIAAGDEVALGNAPAGVYFIKIGNKSAKVIK